MVGVDGLMVLHTPFAVAVLPVLVVLVLVLRVHAYTPAQPANVSLQASGSSSRLHLQWYANGSDWEYVMPQSVTQNPNTGAVQGILVHFTEDNAGSQTTTTPWVAFVSCDTNSTNPSQNIDIFTMAKDRGAKSAILYSLYSETCIVNPSYRSPGLDIFSTQTLNASWRIEYEFGQFGPSSETYYGYFNAAMLNNVAGIINDTIASSYPTAPGFLFSTLPAYDLGGVSGGLESDANGTSNETGSSTSSGSSDSQNTGVAMIVLYAITGCVSALFCAVIVSGAVRAIRYPERYGPRTADPTLGGGQSRARGLGRAILDTFPIVKFGHDRESTILRPKDVESVPAGSEPDTSVPRLNSVQLTRLSPTAEHDDGRDASAADQDNHPSEETDQVDLSPQTNITDLGGSSGVPASPLERDTGMPECIGRETCPICIIDFEEGDDLRVLPCEGTHRFHQSCVDPWLLELSASCPICRQDFRALETIISGEPENDASPANRNSAAGASTTHNRFSRYLRFALRRQGRPNRDQPSPLPQES